LHILTETDIIQRVYTHSGIHIYIIYMFIINTSSIGHMARVTWQFTQINIIQWHNRLVCRVEVFKRIKFQR